MCKFCGLVKEEILESTVPVNMHQVFAAPVRPHSYVEIDHEIFSTVIHSLPLIQEGKLLVSCERMCTEYWLTASRG